MVPDNAFMTFLSIVGLWDIAFPTPAIPSSLCLNYLVRSYSRSLGLGRGSSARTEGKSDNFLKLPLCKNVIVPKISGTTFRISCSSCKGAGAQHKVLLFINRSTGSIAESQLIKTNSRS
jgi:hypothetical protein